MEGGPETGPFLLFGRDMKSRLGHCRVKRREILGSVARRSDDARWQCGIILRPVRHRLYYHLVWTTRNRAPLIDARYAAFACRFLRSVARQERAQVLGIGLVTTHVHVLIRIHPTMDLPRLVQRLKGGSSVIGTREHRGPGGALRWAKGYSITTVSPRAIPAVREYLRAQAQRHPTEVIPDWKGDTGEYEVLGSEEWLGPGRTRFA